MIVVSLLLILVAVTLLVLGLAGGSSSLLIGSIVASLLAAVALVVDVRQAAARRRATVGGMPASPDDDPFLADAPGLDEFAGEPPAHRSARRRADEPSPAMAAASAYPGEDRSNAPARGDAPPDFSGSGTIEDDLASRGRRPSAEPAAPERPHDEFPPPPPPAAAPGVSDREAADPRDADHADGPGDRENADGSPFSGIDADVPPRTAGPESYGAAAGLADEFGEPDEDDPADEPLPQAVRPGDAVRVARMDAEVLVVDSRPRYHLADCPHLVGRLTEPLPANEAVELGFSPCGLCRPVDRLVAGTMHR